MMPPGCKLERKTEQQKRFPPDQPIETWERECGRIVNCDDPNDNTDWTCGDWHKVS
jgi:hypothetical protein